jgi:hypothetical protein
MLEVSKMSKFNMAFLVGRGEDCVIVPSNGSKLTGLFG